MITEQEVWMRAWCAAVASPRDLMMRPGQLASEALRDFRKHFPICVVPGCPDVTPVSVQLRCPLCAKLTKGFCEDYRRTTSQSYAPDQICQCPDPPNSGGISISSTANEELKTYTEPRTIVCALCKRLVSDWVFPDGAPGNICRGCEQELGL